MAEVTVDEERENVESWELLQMLELGLPELQATRLIRAGVRWHDVKAVLDRGATADEAYRILL